MSLQLAILGLLSEGNKSGYELSKEFAYSQSVVWPAPQNEIYRELAKLVKAGHIEDDEEAGPRGRRRYAITRKGRQELKRWLCETDADFTLRYEPVLRAVFFGAVGAEEKLGRLLKDLPFYEEQLGILRDAEKRHSASPEEPDPRRHGRRLAIGLYQAMRDWSLATEAELRRGASVRR